MEQAAVELGGGVATIRTMVKHKTLPARQIAEGVPWMIQREDLIRSEVRSRAQAARVGKPA